MDNNFHNWLNQGKPVDDPELVKIAQEQPDQTITHDQLLSALEQQDQEQREYSGKLYVRLPRSLHRDIVQAARREGTSINQYIIYQLSKGL